ncbi:atp-dependent rna helicase dbp7 [Moniliophthora roreri MCA 2997]|uniref:ATP-dependent RNA helicase n=1 Tax=Moniliophthora roreri (strain MCA 2997) TaxID=1381753 RepID=V2XS21_MONRO|nr:atp-dependent rna helicase dbp7 [Moniliophthora roreri MCA 2997]
MDDGLVLNIADDGPVSRPSSSSKGGRWTDRLKTKRIVKRKTAWTKPTHSHSDPAERQPKRPRTDSAPPAEHKSHNLPTQVISSLFSYNPTIETPKHHPPTKVPTQPSNAPLADSSTFSGLGLNHLLCAHLSSKMNITKPTSIQRAALPPILSTSPEYTERDIFIQSQTGSGKTLSYLLPIIHDLLPLSSLSYIDRTIGTLAIIIAPTRELATQISEVLESLLKLRLRAENESADDVNTQRTTRWLVSGLLIGGATRTHEKARIRKGLPIVVSTPGRLLDHLQNTSSFNVAKCRWLVLDEADRLMELGFEETITGILKGLDGHRKLAAQAVKDGIGKEVGGWDWDRKRRTILCSATIREDVQKLAGATLSKPLMVKATDPELPSSKPQTKEITPASSTLTNFSPPSQLSQNYIVVPLKLRLVVLIALIRYLIAQSKEQSNAKAIVFVSCTDAVDFLWKLLGGAAMSGDDAEDEDSARKSEVSEDEDGEATSERESTPVKCSLLPDTMIYRLHGSLSTQTRLASIRGFASGPKGGSRFSVLLCTSVASRGLDLPLVRGVIQYDLPTEGGATEYVHRVGRTARAGKGGEAWSLVAPSEVEWVKWVEEKMEAQDSRNTISLRGSSVEEILQMGFGGKGKEYEERATQVQLSFERWVLRNTENADLARRAFLSHMRAYATHPSDEKHMFHIRHLHIGHLAKSFALREAPKVITGSKISGKSRENTRGKPQRKPKKNPGEKWEVDHSGDAEKRMQDAVRAQGRQTKKGGAMVSSGTSEFQIAGGYDLERLFVAK